MYITCHVSPIAIEVVCRAETEARLRSATPLRKRRTKPKPGEASAAFTGRIKAIFSACAAADEEAKIGKKAQG